MTTRCSAARSWGAWTACAVALLCTSPSWAENAAEPASSHGQGWSLLSGKTVGNGSSVFSFQLGWPGISAAFHHGIRSNFDVGGRFSFNYGFEGLTLGGVIPGVKLQGLLRVNFVERGRFNMGMLVAPGPMLYFQNNGLMRVGLTIPVYFQFGVAVGSAVMVNWGIDLPMFVEFAPVSVTAPATGLYVPILFGGGIEYFLDRNMAITFNLRMGPAVVPATRAVFTLESLFGMEFKL